MWKYLILLIQRYISVPSKYILGDFHNKVGLHILIRMFHSPNICQAISVLSTQGKQKKKNNPQIENYNLKCDSCKPKLLRKNTCSKIIRTSLVYKIILRNWYCICVSIIWKILDLRKRKNFTIIIILMIKLWFYIQGTFSQL